MPPAQHSIEADKTAAPEPEPAPSLSLLGGVFLSGSSGCVTRLPTRKSLALLALLAEARGQQLRREQLAEMLWPRASQTSARASLRQELAVLRRILVAAGVGSVRSDQDAISLDLSGVVVDFLDLDAATLSDEPETLARVSELYRGDFLESMRPPTQDFEDWLHQLRRNLRDQITDIRLALLRHHQQQGDPSEIKTAARLLLKVDPAQESAHRALMRMYLATGQRQRALQQYELCRKILKAELDVTPQEETEALAEDLRASEAQAGMPLDAPISNFAGGTTRSEPERRNVCILAVTFSNVVELLHSDDAEEFQEILSRAHRSVSTIVADLRGMVIASGGDTVFACFGHEQADEHDVERGIMAARRLTRQVRRDMNLSLTCGIDYGQALVERDGPAGYGVSGLPVLRVDKIVKTAPALGVWMTGAAHDVVDGLFDTEQVPGSGGPRGIPLWKVTGERTIANRFETCRLNHTLTRFVGRELECKRLADLWQDVSGGKFRAVSITGEPGIGKSRLVYQFLQNISGETSTVIQLQGSPHHTATALFPFRQLFGLDRVPSSGNRPDRDMAARLRAWCKSHGTDPEQHVPALLQLFEGKEAGTSEVVPGQKVVHDVLSALADCMRGRLRDGPMILVFEDVQWFDPTSLGFLSEIDGLLQNHPAMVVTTSRSDAAGVLPRADRLTLGPLTKYEAWDLGAALLRRPAGDVALERLLDRSDGIPLHIEELCRTEQFGSAGEGTSHTRSDIPGSLKASLFSRIDQLNEEKALLRAAAVLGRSFDHQHLKLITELDDAELVPLLNTLLERKFLLRTGYPPHAFYEFRNSLVQEVVLQSCLRKRRVELHARAAQVQEIDFHAGSPAAAAAAAWHYGQAGASEQVVTWSLTAARQAIALSAHREAVRHLQTAEAELGKFPQGDDRDATELQILGLLGPQMLATEGFASQTVEEVYERVRMLAKAGPETAGVDVLWGLWSFFVVRASLDRARSIASEFQLLASRSEDPTVHVANDYMAGVSQFYTGSLPEALNCFSRAISRHDAAPKADNTHRFGVSLLVACWSYSGWIHALQSDERGARDAAKAAVRAAERTGHSFSIAFAHVFAAVSYLFLDQPNAAIAHISVALSLAQEHGLRQIEAQALICQGRVQNLKGNPAGTEKIREGLDKYCATGARLARPYALCWIAEGLIRKQALEPAEMSINEAWDHCVATGERYFDAEILRLKGLCQKSSD